MNKHLLKNIAALVICFVSVNSFAQSFSESFNDVSQLSGNGWFIQNNSSPLGANPWMQGVPTNATPTPGPFNAHSGATNAYIAANLHSTTGAGTINNWLLTPNRTFRNGDVITFYTRKASVVAGNTDYPDRLEVRLSGNGVSTNVGTNATDVGDFTTLLLSVNATLSANGYPQVWTQFTITIDGLPAPTSGRIAFRYFVTNGGPDGTSSEYIGVDDFVYTQYSCPAFTMTAGGALTGGAAGVTYSQALTQTGALGSPNFAITGGALPPGITLASNGTISGTPTATGTFNFTATVNDNSGCSGSQSYSITTVCPPNPISLAPAPALCDNSASYALVEGSPAGGTYSGTGVSGGEFDPAAGTQTVTYDYTDPYGCAYNSSYTVTVNTPPTVTLAPLSDVCDNSGALLLTGGSPAGGTFSGTGVTGGEFDPTSGDQTITYTYTDANGCSNEATQLISVFEAPEVTQSAISSVCENSGSLALTGGSPAGGIYSGTGVSAGEFDPASGTQTVTYTFTDANNCTSNASTTITVNDVPTVAFTSPVAEMCLNHGPLTLSGGTPAGGTYSGTGVSGGILNPVTAGAGSHVITYSFTDANNCDGEATFTINVSACLGLDENEAFALEVYPNPTTGLFTVSTSGTDLSIVSVMDIQGKTISFGTSKTASAALEVDLSSQVPGIYFVNGMVDGSPVKFRIQKQ